MAAIRQYGKTAHPAAAGTQRRSDLCRCRNREDRAAGKRLSYGGRAGATGFSSLPTKQNPFWNDYGPGSQNNNSFWASQVMIDFLDSTGDPRVGYYYAKSGAGGIGGEPLGNNTFNVASNTSSFGPALLKSPAQPGVIMLAATSLFMQAEAVQRGLLSAGSAAALYQQGVEASFNFLGVTN